MADDSGQEAVTQDKAEDSKEVKEESLVDEGDEVKQRLQVAEMKAQRFEKILAKYNSDPNFKNTFDAAWEGRQLEREASKVERSLHENDDDPLSSLKSELMQSKEESKTLQQRLAYLESLYTQDKTQTVTTEVANEYRDAFDTMAAEAGYEPGSPAYEILFDKVEKEGNNLAKKHGIAPLAKFNQKLLKAAFNNTMGVMKRAGFDDAWKKKNEAVRNSSSSNSRSSLPPLEKFFTKERLSTKEGQVQAMEEAFRARIKPDFKF